MTDVPGPYFLGLTWQHTRGSDFIGFVKDDAELLADKVDQFARSKESRVLETARR